MVCQTLPVSKKPITKKKKRLVEWLKVRPWVKVPVPQKKKKKDIFEKGLISRLFKELSEGWGCSSMITCLMYTRPWAPSPVLQRKEK
jgi:hypothetical protein